MKLERKRVLQFLLINGYLELTPENIKLYGDSFLLTSPKYIIRHTGYNETLIFQKTEEEYFSAFTNSSRQDATPFYDDEYLEYYYYIKQDDFKMPSEIILERDMEDYDR